MPEIRNAALLAFLSATLPPSPSFAASSPQAAPHHTILLNSGSFDPALAPRGAAYLASDTKRLHLVQLAGPVQPAWYAALEATGVRIVDFIPNSAYLVYGDESVLARLRGLESSQGFVRWQGAYKPPMKMARGLAEAAGSDLYAIQLFEDAAVNAATLALLDELRTGPIRNQYRILHYVNIVATLPGGGLRRLAERPDVISIQKYIPPVKLDERQGQIVAGNLTGTQPIPGDYLSWLAGKGFTQAQFTASGFAVDISDSGIDNATTSPGHPNLYVNGVAPGTSRVIYNRLIGTPTDGSTLQGCDGHGTVNAHIVAGYNGLVGSPHADASGFRYGLGICPFVRLGSSVIFDPIAFTDPHPDRILSAASNDGARISNNSWGSSGSGSYDITAQAYDALVRDAQPTGSLFPLAGNQEMVVVVAAGNGGPGTNIYSPGSAKNVITVGAAEGVRPFSAPDQCGYVDALANSANDLLASSSRGPTADGRTKPDLVAPGSHITSGIALMSAAGSGTALTCYDGAGSFAICGGPGALPAARFFPAGQQFYSTHSGTSVATAAVSGGSALLRQFFLNNALPAPSAAMTKAMLMNAGRYLDGLGANDTLFSNFQGMGEVDLGRLFDRLAPGTTPTLVRDQIVGDTFTASGQTRVLTGTVGDIGKPFRVTLAWTDAPGSTAGNAYRNDLDLVVTAGGNTYRGNVFSGAFSTAGGAADPRNNVESVFLPAGVSGTFTVSVVAKDINSDGVPNSGGALDQDYALVVYNALEASQPVLSIAGSGLTAESCSPPNSAVDPDETVTFDLALQNVGTAPTTSLVATLQATGGVDSPSGPQAYGALAPGGGPVSKPFTFTASGTCGANLTATLDLLDGANPLGSIVVVFRLGQPAAPVVASYAGPAVAIPDANPLGIDVPLVVSGFPGALSDVDFSFDGTSCSPTAGSTTVGLDHTFVGDLVATLRSPVGTTVTLLSRPGGGLNGSGGNNFCRTVLDDEVAGSIQAITTAGEPYTGSFQPANPLSAFDGENPNGTWTLNVSDQASGLTGSVRAFSLRLSRYACCCNINPSASSNSPIVVGQTLNLNALPTIPGAIYAWTGPNGFVAATQNPTLPNAPLAASGTYTVTIDGCASASTNVTVAPAPVSFYTVTPCRVIDTRTSPPALAANASRPIPIGGQCGVPIDATAAVVNITAVSATTAGFLRAHATGLPAPPTIVSIFGANQTRANNASVALGGAPASLTIYDGQTSGSVDVVVDVSGYYR